MGRQLLVGSINEKNRSVRAEASDMGVMSDTQQNTSENTHLF